LVLVTCGAGVGLLPHPLVQVVELIIVITTSDLIKLANNIASLRIGWLITIESPCAINISIPTTFSSKQIFCDAPVVNHKKLIALTFDDGPNPVCTPQIPEILSHYKAKATFFVVGKQAKTYPSLSPPGRRLPLM
jgi:hypothetical protein